MGDTQPGDPQLLKRLYESYDLVHVPGPLQALSRLARELVARHPERCVWASNWPHPNRNPAPSNAAMLDLLLDWAPAAAVRNRILVDNPAQLYGFD